MVDPEFDPVMDGTGENCMRLKARLQRLAQQATKKRRYDYAAGLEKQRQHISRAAGLWMRGEYSLASGLAAHRHAIVRLHQPGWRTPY